MLSTGLFLAILCIHKLAAAQNYSESIKPAGSLPSAPYISPQVFNDSGYEGYGAQPILEEGVPLYDGTFAPQAYPGGTQEVLYYDAEIPVPTYTGFYAQIVNLTACSFSTPHFHPDIVEMNYVLAGDGLLAGLFLQTDAVHSLPTWATGLNAGGVATVTANSIHYASNPSCGNASLLQVFAGLPKGYTYLPYIDLPTVLLSQDVEAMAISYGWDAAQTQTALSTVRPLFAVNQTCLQECQAKGLVPSTGSPAKAPSTPLSG